MFGRIRGLFQSFTRRPMTKRGVLVCPRCGSTRIRQADSISGVITPPRYFCPNCYYSGYFVVEKDKDEDKNKENYFEGFGA
ncbi:MAG: hypothetical protein WED07_04810 [Candidatus Freyarchaeum deiterrae]